MNFEEQFPSLKDKWNTTQDTGEYLIFYDYDIEKYCLDKQKVREAIEKVYMSTEELAFIFRARLLKELGL